DEYFERGIAVTHAGFLSLPSISSPQQVLRYLAFDLVSINGISVAQRSFSTRLGILQQDIIAPRRAWVAMHPESKEPFP
ncbi:hypothetical protein BDK51DRAFT_50439, partial [Blyttiomyces helicus]